MEIILIRHGQSSANAMALKQNLVDYPLSELGKKQARKIVLKEHIDVVYTSPLKRSVLTARILSRRKRTKIIADPRLIEWQVFPELEGYTLTKEKREAINPYLLRYPLKKKYGNGESFYDIHTRLNDFLLDCILKSANERVVIVSHAAAINHLIYLLLFGYNLKERSHYDFFIKLGHIKNCSLTKIVINEKQPIMETYNQIFL